MTNVFSHFEYYRPIANFYFLPFAVTFVKEVSNLN